MASYTWTLPSAGPDAVVGGGLSAQFDRLYGRDIYLEVNGSAGPDLATTKAGDWILVTGRQALRQSLIRRWITTPGEFATKPGYGAGALAFLKARGNSDSAQDLANRIRAESLKDRRVERVEAVHVSWQDSVMRIHVVVVPKGESDRPLPIVLEVG